MSSLPLSGETRVLKNPPETHSTAPTHISAFVFLRIVLALAPSCDQPRLSHKESILSPALNSQGKAWVTIQTVPGERGVSKDVFGVVAALPANIRFTVSFQTSGAEN